MTMFQRSTVSNLKRYKKPKKNPLAKDVNTKHECVTIMRVKQECLEQYKHRRIVVVDTVSPR